MSRCWRKLILTLPLLAALPLAAVPEQPAGNAPAPAERRRDPADAALLRQEARAFLTLPAERRERMIKLDVDIQQAGSPARQQHLLDVLRRYADWLDRLPEHERRLVTEAPTKKVRLRRIRELREEQWLRRQPKAIRDGLAALRAVAAAGLTLPRLSASAELCLAGPMLAPAAGGQPFLTARLRQEERRRHRDWQIALRHWDDLGKGHLRTRLSDFTDEVRKYVTEYLTPMLSAEEKALLHRAEGQLRFPYVLVQLADRHPPALPGKYGPKSFKELPTDVQERIKKMVMMKGKGAAAEPPVLKKQIRAAEGKWPKFAVEITKMVGMKAKKLKLSSRYELWPSHLWELSPEVQKFVRERLLERLNGDEKALLARSEGKWPEYPQTIEDLAARHGLQIPWQTLPGARKIWDLYRIGSQRGSEQLPGFGEAGLALLEPAPRASATLNGVFARLPGLPAFTAGPFWPRRADRR